MDTLIIDIILIAFGLFIIAWYTFRGFFRAVLRLLSLILASVVSNFIVKTYSPPIFVFFLIFIVAFVALTVVLKLIDKIIKKITVSNVVNRLLGFLLGCVSAYIALSVATLVVGLVIPGSADNLFMCRFFSDYGVFKMIFD